MRRILYVAATRAREELHIFARSEYKNTSGTTSLIEPNNCLLATAWPAFKEEIRARFEEWESLQTDSHQEIESVVEAIAASSGTNLAVMPNPARPTLLRRLPPDFTPLESAGVSNAVRSQDYVRLSEPERYKRHEGGIPSRALGTAVHELLEESARLRATNDWTAAHVALSKLLPYIKAQIRATGLTQSETKAIAAQALEIAQRATKDPVGRWILSPHAEGASEAAWTGIVADALRSIRVDRVFRAGPEPLSEGEDAWWIIDFKTAHAENLDPSVALSALRTLFAPQLEAYAVILRGLHSEAMPIRAGLYYPRMSMFDWWAVDG
jgi:ATP-dependent exoDNAse (exonuclease V) beta subunit